MAQFALAQKGFEAASSAASSLGGPGNVVYGPNGEVIVQSFEAAPESHTSMVKYLIIGMVVIAVMLIFWLMSQGPVKPYEFKSFMGFTPARATIQTHQRMYGVIPSLMGNGLSN
jgi:hypothetical protein